ncbi:MAG: T9SS type A sorting domain-containing protein [Saprospirales bacterium]|nr:T9SS type A sorting domain-containing protein [Saprospirales bacterium]
MKNLFTPIIFLLISAFAPLDYLQAQCSPGNAQTDLKVNNVKARLRNTGDIWWDGTTGMYVVPYTETSNVSALFTGALWLSGYTPGGALRLAAPTYGAQFSQFDYWPGPLSPSTGEVTTAECNNWNKFFQVNRTEINAFQNDFADNGVLDDPIPPSILGWPAKGNPFFAQVNGYDLPFGEEMAPYYDRNENDKYEPHLGDVPLLKGDVSIWWVYNDNGNFHADSGGEPLKMEIQANAFSYNTQDDPDSAYIDNSTFYEFKLKYRGDQPLANAYFSLWVDPDLGCYQDDYIGCLPDHNMAFVYNGDTFDETCVGINGYGSEIPVLGMKVIKPFSYLDNDNVEQVLPFSSFTYYLNAGGALGIPYSDPDLPNEYYNYMTGKWRDGTPFSKGGNGYNPGAPAYPYAFDNSDNNGQAWTECTITGDPDDRRFLMNFGPINVFPGEEYEFVYAVMFWPNQPYPCPDLENYVEDGDSLVAFYNWVSEEINNIPQPSGVSQAPFEQSLIKVFPNPMDQGSWFYVKGDRAPIRDLTLTNIEGQVVRRYENVQQTSLLMERNGLPSGAYFYQALLEDGTVSTGKLILQ